MKRLISFLIVVVLAAMLLPLNTVDAASYEPIAKLTAFDGAAYDYFSMAVSISGNTMVVGAVWDDDKGTNSGSAYVFERNQGGADNWGLVKKLTASDGAILDLFGAAVSISGDTIVVGSPFADASDTDSGSAYVFERNLGGANMWGEVQKLTADGGVDEYFGYAVSISEDTIVVGAEGDDANGTLSGSAYVFERNQGGPDNWGLVTKLTAFDGIPSAYFGMAVSINGDTTVVGAYWDDDKGTGSGSAYVFERNQGGPGNWGLVKKLTVFDGAEYDHFGYAVSISGDTMVVGAYWDEYDGTNLGSAYVFERNLGGADNWGLVKKLTAFDGAADDYFGYAVSISGDTMVIGAYYDDDNGPDSGSAYVFGRNEGGAGNWGEVKKLTASDGAADDYFGYAVSISGDTMVLGAPYDDDKGTDSGSAYVFQISSPAEPPSVPASVPGVSFWGNVALAVLIAGAMVWSVRRRRVSAEAR